MKIPIALEHERLILVLNEIYPKVYIRSPKSPDFNLSREELYFRLGQRSVIDNLIDELNQLKKGES